jgi:hypothetical protein
MAAKCSGYRSGMADDEFPSDAEVDEELIEPEFIEYDGRMFAVAAVVPHPTAIRVIMELGAGDEVEHRRLADLVAETGDPVFWVVTYADAIAALRRPSSPLRLAGRADPAERDRSAANPTPARTRHRSLGQPGASPKVCRDANAGGPPDEHSGRALTLCCFAAGILEQLLASPVQTSSPPGIPPVTPLRRFFINASNNQRQNPSGTGRATRGGVERSRRRCCRKRRARRTQPRPSSETDAASASSSCFGVRPMIGAVMPGDPAEQRGCGHMPRLEPAHRAGDLDVA